MKVVGLAAGVGRAPSAQGGLGPTVAVTTHRLGCSARAGRSHHELVGLGLEARVL